MNHLSTRLREHLTFLYGPDAGAATAVRVERLIADYQPRLPPPQTAALSERDSVLITYGDMVQDESQAPLCTLADFLHAHVADTVSTVHLLPFFPSSSDDGFSVIDYKRVDPALGDWPDVARLGRSFRLMFDAVVNHVSAHSEWFGRFLADEPAYRDFFTVVDGPTDLSAVFRPRALPLLTEVKTAAGPKRVWTTFSTDQIDLNYANPEVLLRVLDTLLFYVAHGAEFIRLDAIAFIWKAHGTPCIHLPQTHRLVQLMRTVLDIAAPQVALITETNVPHRENISYFGNGRNEAQMVYNFPLPPLTLHAFHTGDATILSRWAAGLTLPSGNATFFNFLASHDGIGVTPARGLLPPDAVEAMARRVAALGGHVSYRNQPDGSQIAYELNVNYLDALGDPDAPEQPTTVKAQRFLAAQAIMLALRGVPGIYFHSLFGSRNWPEGVAQTGRYRTINRQKLRRAALEAELAQSGSLRQQIFSGYSHLLRVRAAHPAFHPHGEQAVLTLHPAVFAVRREARAGGAMLCLHNVSARPAAVQLPAGFKHDLLRGDRVRETAVTLAPYQILWLAETAASPR